MTGFKLEVQRAAIVITDPQVDFLSPQGTAWALVGESVERAGVLPAFKPYFLDGRTIVASAHRACGPERDDLATRLRRSGVDQVVLAGMSANLCVESHLRALLECGFGVAVVEDATAATTLSDGDGYQAALINFHHIADAVWSTDEAVRQM